MNKKIKISLLSVLLTSSLAGVATTIASCSSSAIPQLTIVKNPFRLKRIIATVNMYKRRGRGILSGKKKSKSIDGETIWVKKGDKNE